MFEVLRKELNIGDKVKFFLTSGQEPEGIVSEIGDGHLVLTKDDGKPVRIFERVIGGWEVTSKNISIPEEIEEVTKVEIDEVNYSQNGPNEIIEENLPEKIETQQIKLEGLKILGTIDLDKIPSKKIKQEQEQKVHRLTKICKDFEKNIKEVGDLLRDLGYGGSLTPNARIPDEFYIKLRNRILEQKSVEEGESNDVLGIKANSFEQLKQLQQKVVISIEDQYLAANAVIKRSGHKGYGYLTDKEGTDYYFSYTNVDDDKLFELLNSGRKAEGLQVICEFNSFKGKMSAKRVMQPQKIGILLENCENLIKDHKYSEAKYFIDKILVEFPDFEDAIELKKKVQYNSAKKQKEFEKIKNSYNSAKTEIKRGNFEEAKKLLLQAIEINDFKSENALKEMAYLLQREGDIDDAIVLVKQHKNKIKSSDPNNLIAYFYETKKDFNSALHFLLQVDPKTPNEELKLEKRKALAYFALSDLENAEKSINYVLREKPDDESFQRFYDILQMSLSGASDEEIQAIFNEAQLITLSGGLSPYIEYSLQNCEYKGLPKEILAEEKYDLNALKSIRNYIEKAAGNRPIEKAEFLLTEAKLMQSLTPEKEIELNEVLAKRNMALAEASSLTGKPTEILRFFLIEAFKLAPDISFVARHLPIFFASFYNSSLESLKSFNIAWKETLRMSLNKKTGSDFWHGLSDLLVSNSSISNSVLTYLFQEKKFRNECYKFLDVNIGSKDENTEKEEFIKIWNEKLNSIKRSKSNWNSRLMSVSNSITLDSMIENFEKTIFPLPFELNLVDRDRINQLNEIFKLCSEFITQQSFEDKERYFSIINNQINQLTSEIEESPTELSFNILRRLLMKLDDLVSSVYTNFVETSKPDISISMLGEGVLNENDSLVNLQINVSNKKGSAPVSYLELKIENNEEIYFVEENKIIDQTLKGGEDRILRIIVKVSDKIKKEEAGNLTFNCIYKVRGYEEQHSFKDNLTMRLYTENDFVAIDNPFAATADSGPVTDPEMFFGREVFIENMKNSILESSSKCIVIYGQKRSGKSSVLYHLRKKLINESNAFCISFSLGEIVEDLSSLTFYYKVLSEIDDSLEDMRDMGLEVPNFESPTLSELKTAPAIIFNESLKNFNRSISKLDSWKSKKLILLIDEFTYIYTAIQKEVLSNDFMKSWKSFLEKEYFTSVLIGQDIMPKFMEDFPNEFGVTEPKRLSYLDRTDAAKLIEQPIWDEVRNRSRFLGKSVDYLLDYTSSNPYYIQIFCARLVEYMNYHNYISVTEADVIDVANSFISGEKSLSVDKFDNLITAGDADLEAFKPQDVLKALKEIALASRNLESCNVETINLGDKYYGNKILKDLKTREVISTPIPDYYKINVRLFKEWLLLN